MDSGYVPQVAVVALAGIVGGVLLLVRGMGGYRTATQLGDTATSRIGALAAGEVQVSGVIEPAELTLISALQSVPCVYYRSTIGPEGEFPEGSLGFEEERAVGFRVRDASGSVRVFPRGARWDAPTRYDDSTGLAGDEPPGLLLRSGPAISTDALDRAAAIATLTTIPVAPEFDPLAILGGMSNRYGLGRRQRRRYHEKRMEPGDPITVVGRALPFSDLNDPAEADIAEGSLGADDPEVSGDIAEARAAGLLAATPEEAWGNAAIPGFAIGRPARAPRLDPNTTAQTVASPADATEFDRRFAIAPETLILASAPDVPLLIVHGVPEVAAGRQQRQFIVGLLGAVLAIGSAMALALLVGAGFAS